MNNITKMLLLLAGLNISALPHAQAEALKIFTWEGYVTQQDISAVNSLLKEQGYGDFTAEVISTFAEGPEQMFKVMRKNSADISFLTLNYIKMQNDKVANLLQPINTASPRLSNYQNCLLD